MKDKITVEVKVLDLSYIRTLALFSVQGEVKASILDGMDKGQIESMMLALRDCADCCDKYLQERN
jgi:hypothetical protein